jgi:HK97 family phage portal protein
MWDYQFCGEVVVVATARYATGWPARFHVVPPWTVEVDHAGAGLSYRIGSVDLDPRDVLHIRYQASAADTRGHGPLEAGRPRLVAAGVLLRYLTNFVQGGAVPSSVLESPEEVTAKQASDLQAQWVNSRMNRLGLPAVIGGGMTWKATQVDPLQSALAELAAYTEAKIAILCGVPPLLLGLPSGGDSMTYRNAEGIYDFHWRGGIRLRTARLLPALSAWLTPRGTRIEVNRDEYVRPGPFERAQTWAIYLEHGVVSVEDVQRAERFTPVASMLELGAS